MIAPTKFFKEQLLRGEREFEVIFKKKVLELSCMFGTKCKVKHCLIQMLLYH
jgi:hypothetical protein